MKESFVVCDMPGCGARVPASDTAERAKWRALLILKDVHDNEPTTAGDVEFGRDLCPDCAIRVVRIFNPNMVFVLRPKKAEATPAVAAEPPADPF